MRSKNVLGQDKLFPRIAGAAGPGAAPDAPAPIQAPAHRRDPFSPETMETQTSNLRRPPTPLVWKRAARHR